jgi:hypothetical protein
MKNGCVVVVCGSSTERLFIMNDANRHWLNQAEIAQLREHCLRNNIPWPNRRTLLLEQGSKGNLSDKAFNKYKKLLLRILYEMKRRRSGKRIHRPDRIVGLSPRYY